MINGTAVRLCVVAALIPVTYWGAALVKASLQPPETEMPDWTFRDLPARIGVWRGEETTMDPLIAVATNAKLDTIVNRAYRDDSGHVISMHAAMFEDPNGVLHSPLVCYQAAGWTRLSESRKLLHLKLSDKSELPLPISISRWENEKDNKKVMVVYWFQLGEHFLFGRWDLGMKIRWSLSGQVEMARPDQSDDGDPRHRGRGTHSRLFWLLPSKSPRGRISRHTAAEKGCLAPQAGAPAAARRQTHRGGRQVASDRYNARFDSPRFLIATQIAGHPDS